MSKPILQKTSFGILRTNPKLTSNVKLIADSNDIIYLESFSANSELSKSKYKGFKVSSASDYYFDLYRFYNQGSPVTKEKSFDIFERSDSLSISDRYGVQFDMTYAYGAEPKNSKLYPEEFGLLAPLWIEPSNIPDYFIICRIEDPVSVNTKTAASEADPSIISQIIDSANFTDNILKNSTIITKFDLTNESNLGRYIRRHVNNEAFPESGMNAKWEKDGYFQYNGIALDRPGFVSRSKNMYYESWPNDSTIIEYENKLTNGFSDLNVVHPNIINLEFLFDDDSVDDYRFQRYFGLYVNKAEYNKFFLDGGALFQDRFNQTSQLPLPVQNTVGYDNNTQDQVQTNENGIVLYAEQPPISSINGTSFFPNELVYDTARIGYVEDASGEFHKIKNSSQFDAGTIRLNDKSINWKNFTGFQEPENYVSAEFNNAVKGRPACVIEFTSAPVNDDEFRVFFTDPTDPSQLEFIDSFTLTASDSIPLTTSDSNLYSSNGTTANIAQAFAKCFNDRNAYYPDLIAVSAIAINSKVVIYSRIPSETWNKIKVTSFSQATIEDDIAINFISGQSTDYTTSLYESSPQPFSAVLGFLATGQFVGGNNNTLSKIKVASSTTDLFVIDKYLTTNKGFSKILNVVPYLDQPIKNELGEITGFEDFDDYYTVNITDTDENIILTSSQQAIITPLRFNNCGLLSIYPMKDFDFDFYNKQYNKDADSDTSKLLAFYLGQTGPFGQTSSFDVSAPGLTGTTGWIDTIIGPDSAFIEDGGFQNLMGISNTLEDTDSVVYNEYDRLKENAVKQLALDSRVVPFINKWVFDDDGTDVRQNPYRLNVDASFRYSNFSPSFREFQNNPKFYTHEWYYLQKYPPYMDFEERKDSWSYFNNAINIGSTYATGTTSPDFGLATVDGPASEDLDYFSEYFTRETIDIPNEILPYPVTQETKYSTFAYGTDVRFAETLFRGVKVIVKERFESSDINYDINKKKLKNSTKYNDYKFASIISLVENGITYKLIENEKYKTITLVIEAGFQDPYFTKIGSGASGSTDPNDYFIDRTLIYTLRDKLKIGSGGNYEPVDKELSGAISQWSGIVGNVTILGKTNFTSGTPPNFVVELQKQEDGSYNNIVIQHPTNNLIVFVIENIISASTNTIVADNIRLYNKPYVEGTSVPLPNDLLLPIWTVDPVNDIPSMFNDLALWSEVPNYLNGGYRGYEGIIDNLAFAYIADAFNSGDPTIEYITYKEDGSIVNNDKIIELSLPIEAIKANYLVPDEDTQVPNELDSILSGSVAGYQIGASEKAIVNVMARYDGRYQPKFNDVLYFLDYDEAYIPNTSIGITGPRYYGFDNYLNLEFNTYESKFGFIDNYFYNKCNPENPQGVLRLSDSKLPSVYPLTGEIAIDKRDFYTFYSNWDMGYYKKAIDRTTEESIIGYRGVLENKSFFGSKIISIPDKIRLENFTIIDIDDLSGGLSGISNVPESVVKTINKTSSAKPKKAYTKKSSLVLDVFTTKALTDFLRLDGFDSEFNKYINPSFSFGEAGLDDDIIKYIQDNIFQRYSVKRIIFYENRFANNVNQLNTIELDLSNFELLKKGYKISENLSVKYSTQSPLNFTLIYNIPKLDNYSISFKVDLEKK